MRLLFAAPPSLEAAALPGYAETYGASVLQLDSSLAAAHAPADLIDLTHGDTRAFGPPATATEDFLAAVTENTEAYTPYRGSPALRSLLAPRLEFLLGRPVDPQREVLITPGTQGGLFTALSALLAPGDRLILPDPEYFMSERIAAYLGARPVRLEVQQDEEGSLSLRSSDLNVARAACARLLLLSHPNNPTGGVYTAAAVEDMARLAIAGDMVVVVDQLYCRLVFPPATYRHLGALPGMIERTVTLVGPSKTESMSGYRVAVAVGPPAAIDSMERVLALASLRAAGYGQQALRHWMDDDADWLEQRVTDHCELRDVLVDRLRAIPRVTVATPAGSSYVFPLVEDGGEARGAGGVNDYELAIRLKSAGVLVSPGYQFGPAGRGRFRINFSQDRARLLNAADRITATLAR